MSSAAFASVASWEYRDIAAPASDATGAGQGPHAKTAEPPPVLFTEHELSLRVERAVSEANQAWQTKHHAAQQQREQRLAATLSDFSTQRTAYFRQVETEIVQLALAIARRILQREAHIDPTLLGGLVRVALDRLAPEPPIRVRLAPTTLSAWQSAEGPMGAAADWELVADAGLSEEDCVVETNLGSANFSFDAQLKQIEQGFLDLLAHRPDPA